MSQAVWVQLEFLLRIIIASICGAFIGYERESRLKMAGIRTHIIVSLASALMMIISKYGFFDVFQYGSVGLDPSRIAAGVVTAIGFLGAGVIFNKKQNIIGLTTAAGVWATLGVGMAIGSGLYFMGISSTILIIIIQLLLHKNFKWLNTRGTQHITLKVKQEDTLKIFTEAMNKKHVKISNIKASRIEDDYMEIKMQVQFPEYYELQDIVNLMKDYPFVILIDV